jgi:hypothetical protein
VKRNLIEIQVGSELRTIAQLSTLIRESNMICAILAISPQSTQGDLAWGSHLHALIVHDPDWYLLRDAHPHQLRELLPVIRGISRVFFVAEHVQILTNFAVQDAADYLVSLQPCILTEKTAQRLLDLAQPAQGTRLHLAQPAMNH